MALHAAFPCRRTLIMPPLQTSYAARHPDAYEGMQANAEPVTILTRIADTDIAFGKPVVQGVKDQSVRLPSATAARFLGIALAVHTVPALMGQAVDTYPAGSPLSVLNKGVIWVRVAASVSAGAAAYLTSAGAITASSSGNTAIPNATFDTSAPAGGLARLRLS
ncbi:Hypothetical protein GbCGDNIH9_1580 [Granulibacter bethesdensis]|uniref:Uncharacterized protein n=2 Tax=Granulibacter bethesdensis TaxID=364410 RepID=A0AAC9KAW3_9PROT|nr:Hypothetical protein GbCGDNIH9_1580 [Granulibacter bethesdensis]APH62455.1 Hypothetical protein GbCGDNIH8_1580 [Granulibacter bethesdensis]